MDNHRRIGLRAQLLILGLLGVLPFVLLLSARDHEARSFAKQNANDAAKYLSWTALTGQTIQIKSTEQILKALSVVPDIWDADKCNKLMGELLAQNPRYASFGLISPNGDIFCSGIPFTPPINVADRLYFKKAVETKAFAIGEYQIGRVTNKPTVNFGFPVYANDGVLRGVLISALDLRWLNRVLEGITLPTDTEAFVIDRNGTVLAHHPNPDAWIGKTFTGSPIVKNIFNTGREGTVESQGLDGIVRLFAFSPLPTAFGGNETYVVIGLSSAVATAESNNILRRDVLIVAISTIVMLIFGWLAGEWVLLRRLQIIVDASKRFASGRFSTLIPPMVSDEIGQLALSFNDMATQLKGLYRNLEERVREKTQEIENERMLLEMLIENLPVGVVVAEIPSGVIRTVNNMGKQLFGFKTNKQRTLSSCGFVNEDGSLIPKENLPMTDTIINGKAFTNNTGLFLKNSSVSPIALRVSGAVTRSNGQSNPSAIFVIDDMSKEFAIDKAKSEFVSLASHQLRTPLTATNWFCEMLLSGDAGRITKTQKDFLQQLSESNKRMIDLVNSLLSVSRIEAGKFSVEPEVLDIPAIVNGIFSDYSRQTKEKRLTVTTDFDGVSKYVGDEKIIRLILENFISNAIKYSHENGEILLALNLTKKEIQINVTDSGYGIPAKQQDKVFTKLFRADNIKLVDTEGSGLGLYMVKALVEQIGGRVWFTSKENTGSTFYAALPSVGMEKRKGEKVS
jgi:signal transduction histidine kinase